MMEISALGGASHKHRFYMAHGSDAFLPLPPRHLGGSTRAWEDTQSWASLDQVWLSSL